MPLDHATFIRTHVRPAPVTLIPEIQLHQADDPIGLWELNEGEYRSEQPPPFWAFAWAGGIALARYVLDHPELAAGRRVLDLAAGSGVVAIAAALAGAAAVRAIEVDPLAVTAIDLNVSTNGVAGVVTAELGDIVNGDAGDAELVLAGDVFYSKAMAERVFGFLRRSVRRGATVLVGDPGRAFLPRAQLIELSTIDVPVTWALESAEVKHTTVYQLPGPGQRADR